MGLIFTPLLSVEASVKALSVTPTIFEMAAVPGQQWESSVKVINQNAEPLTVYAEAVNFAPQGERGHGTFVPVYEDLSSGTTLAEWIEVSSEAFEITPEGSTEIPLTIKVPEEAAPGGHYAAIMIGTKPPTSADSPRVATAQVISSLFFVRIAGDVTEAGSIRSFQSLQKFIQTPEVSFALRFENKGNVHLQPQGEIVITNMWGRERGVIPINQKTHFGNVLPDSVRRFEFTWSGDFAFSDIGRYQAVVTLGYGRDQRTFITRETSFWLVPVKPVLIILVSVIGSVLFVVWMIRMYVRRMLALSGVVPAEMSDTVPTDNTSRVSTKKMSVWSSWKAPLTNGVIDLRSQLAVANSKTGFATIVWGLIKRYPIFWVACAGLLGISLLVWWYLQAVLVPARNYDITISTPGQETTLSSEEILYEQMQTDTAIARVSSSTQQYEIEIQNSSGEPGRAAAVATQLAEAGYEVGNLTVEKEQTRNRTVIVYDQALADAAIKLSTLLDGALLSARPDTDATTTMITIHVGDE